MTLEKAWAAGVCAMSSTEKEKNAVARFAVSLEAFEDQSEVSDMSDATTRASRMKKIVNSSRFNACIGVVILINLAVMGMELDQHPLAEASTIQLTYWGMPEVPQLMFDAFEVFFFFVFAIEFLLRAVVRWKKMLMEISSYVDLLALSPVVLIFVFNLNASRHLTLIRVVRLLKLSRLFRLIRLFKELNVLACSIVSAMRALTWIGLFLLLTVYCSALVCTTLIGHNTDFLSSNEHIEFFQDSYGEQINISRYWGSVPRSMLTLFQIFTLDDWNRLVRPIVETHLPIMLFFFVCFLFLTTFGLLNLLMGSIVDHALSVHKDSEMERERVIRDEHKQMMIACLRLFTLMDTDGNGLLSATEIAAFLERNLQETLDVLHKEMKHLNIKLDSSELLDICLSILDVWPTGTNSDNSMTMEEFAGAATRMHGVAKSRDMLSVLLLAQKSLSCIESQDSTLKNLLSWTSSIVQNQERLDTKTDKLLKMFGLETEERPQSLPSAMVPHGHSSESSDHGGNQQVLPFRSGRGRVRNLLQILKGDNEFACTKTVTAIEAYSTLVKTNRDSVSSGVLRHDSDKGVVRHVSSAGHTLGGTPQLNRTQSSNKCRGVSTVWQRAGERCRYGEFLPWSMKRHRSSPSSGVGHTVLPLGAHAPQDVTPSNGRALCPVLRPSYLRPRSLPNLHMEVQRHVCEAEHAQQQCRNKHFDEALPLPNSIQDYSPRSA